jgi:hypothetical protein
MMRPMTALRFHPHFVEVLEQLARRAELEGAIDVECRADVDPAVVAVQIRQYAERTGRALVCRARAGKVEVSTNAHPSLGRTG